MPQAAFDVFLSHNSADKPDVLKLAAKLKDMGLNPWLDAWHLVAGEPWLPAIDRALRDCGACAVVVGPHGLGNVHEDEMWVALQQGIESKRGDRRFRVIPILLPNSTRGDRARLPAFLTANTWVEFQRSIDEPAALDKLAKAIRGEVPGTGVRLPSGESPYRGLAYFDVQHWPLFFGREAPTDWLLSRLRGTASKDGATRFLAIVGASGSGKSSLARAGVLAKLKQGELPGSACWPLVICRPRNRPLESLATDLANTDGINLGSGLRATLIRQLADELLNSPEQLHLVAQGAMPANDPDWRLVVFVDQFEELFTLNQPDPRDAQVPSPTPALSSDRIAFFRNLLRAATIENGRTIVILTMRADFYGKCAAFPELATAVSQHQELVGPMSADELRRAIETPAQLSGSDIEPGLVDLLTQEVADQPGALPLLQYALAELWQKSRDLGFSKLTASAYRELGGWEGALSRRADAVLAEFKNTPQEDLCRQLFLRLVQPGEGTEDTKRLVRWQELKRETPSESAALEQTVRNLADNRLITTSGEDLNADSTIEVVHEALIRSWPELRQWLDADRAGLRIQLRLTEAAKEWAKSHVDVSQRDPTLLYAGTRLAVAREWADKRPRDLSSHEREFLDASWQALERERAQEGKRRQREARAAKRYKRLTVVLGGTVLLVGVLAGISWRQWSIATEARAVIEGERDYAIGLDESFSDKFHEIRQKANQIVQLADTMKADPAGAADLKNLVNALQVVINQPRRDKRGGMIVKLFFGTDRHFDDNASYGTRRGSLDFGYCDVSLPLNHRFGEIEQPLPGYPENPAHHVALRIVRRMEGDRFAEFLQTTTQPLLRRDLLIFVHGINVTFGDAARRAAQLSTDMRFDGVAMFFSWPSQGGRVQYLADEAQVGGAADDMARFLDAVVENSAGAKIHIVADGLGCQLLLNAFSKNTSSGARPRFQEVVLLRPDIDVEEFDQRFVPQLQSLAKRVTIYVAEQDATMRASQQIHRLPRLGGTISEFPDSVAIDVIATSANEELGHSYVLTAQTYLVDLAEVLRGVAAENRPGLVREANHFVLRLN